MTAVNTNPVLTIHGDVLATEPNGVRELDSFAPTVRVPRYVAEPIRKLVPGESLQIPLGPVSEAAFLSLVSSGPLSITLVTQPGDVQLGPFTARECLLGHCRISSIHIQNLGSVAIDRATIVFGGPEDT